ncbi:neuropeptides B/W receptor type 2-like [Denticeps clupeoides]|uniref:G-protein coupled receptors family 1 profile domain-containing protein n=1 Tax=Denticeps clupeoides TaxID=299321 RepID=A0AAY4ECC9_9TELE|nr:neuropeptides B/W receptor type 2-like [Denticeps clupeoides]
MTAEQQQAQLKQQFGRTAAWTRARARTRVASKLTRGSDPDRRGAARAGLHEQPKGAAMENASESDRTRSECDFYVDHKERGNWSQPNCTVPPWLLYPDFYVALPIIYSVICAVGLTGNTAVIYVILKAPKMMTVTNIFILNLAIADDLFTLVLPINIAEHLLNCWPFGEALCKVILSIDHYNIFSSIYFLTVMSVDRYLVVLATVRSRRLRHRTFSFAKTVSVCVWTLVTAIVLPFTVFAGVYVNPEDVESRKSCVLSFPSPESFWFRASRIYTLVLGFVIPVSTICILYSVMLYKLRNMQLNSNAKALDKAKRKATVLVFIVLAVCLFCWTPFHLSTIVALTTDLPATPLVIGISYFITSLSYANSCLNPFLYAFIDDSFRKAFRKMLECGNR